MENHIEELVAELDARFDSEEIVAPAAYPPVTNSCA